MKYIFEMFHTSERKNNRDPGARFDRSIIRTQAPISPMPPRMDAPSRSPLTERIA
jgi:hypothetical protein